MPVLKVGEILIPYELRKSQKATRARLTVTPNAIEVVVPASVTDDDIAAMLHQRRAWLLEQTRRMAELAAQAEANAISHFVSGAKIPFRGRMMRLTVEPTDGAIVEVSYRNGFVVGYPRKTSKVARDSLIETAIRLWFRKRLREDVGEVVRRFGHPNDLRPKRLEIKDQKHLWGSCGQDRVLNLNWHLIFAPKPVLEYAVVHELCHLQHRNHDASFWNLVGTIMPDWEKRKAWLDANEHFLEMRRLASNPECQVG